MSEAEARPAMWSEAAAAATAGKDRRRQKAAAAAAARRGVHRSAAAARSAGANPMADLEKCKVSELKQRCKAAGVAGTGEKPDLVNRLKQHAAGESCKLDGTNPACLKNGELKKALAVRGLPCSLDLETRDVLVGRLIDALRSESGGGGGASGSAGGDAGGGESDADAAIKLAVEMAKQVLALGEAGDASGVLSLLGSPITAQSPFAQQRKAYLQLSRMIHPDKLSRHFDQATRAFQELVRAFDEINAPPPSADDEPAAKKPKTAAISRTNQNCFRTRLYCPRCDAEWATQDSGLQTYDYNLMMQGLKLYCCALCLCEFGCVSAKHRCPHCHQPFAYHPNDFHRQLTCGSKRCAKAGNPTFGFMLYHIPPRVENELRATIKVEQERRLKAREASMARQARAARKAPALSEGARQKQAEACFLRGLLDCCPRCGYEPPPGVKLEELEAHLTGCNDKEKQEAYRKGVEKAAAKAAAKAAVKDSEAEAQNLMAWQFLGGTTEQMWMLTDKQLEKQCEERGVSVGGDKGREQLLLSLAQDQRAKDDAAAEAKASGGGASGQLRLTASSSSSSAGAGGGGSSSSAAGGGKSRAPPRLSAASLPDNLHSMSLPQLRAVCASHGFIAKGTSSEEVIKEIEALLYKGTDAQQLLLE